MRFKIGTYIYFLEFRREQIYAKGLTKKEFQKQWHRKKK